MAVPLGRSEGMPPQEKFRHPEIISRAILQQLDDMLIWSFMIRTTAAALGVQK